MASTVKTKESPWAELLWARLVQFGPDPACWDWLREQAPDPDAIDRHAPEFRDALRLVAAEWCMEIHPEPDQLMARPGGTSDYAYASIADTVRVGEFADIENRIRDARANRRGDMADDEKRPKFEAYWDRCRRACGILAYVEGIP